MGTLGILAVGLGIGGQSLFRIQPFHTMLYMLNRSGAAIADTSTAALVASYSTQSSSSGGDGGGGSNNKSSKSINDRSRNLALLTSTRAAARIFSPLLSTKLFELSCKNDVSSTTRKILAAIIPAGALPFVSAACCCMAIAPLPTVLHRAGKRADRKAAMRRTQ